MISIGKDLIELLYSLGASIVGFADLHEVEAKARERFPRGVSIAVALDPHVAERIIDGPTIEYYADYERANNLLDLLAKEGARFIESYGHRAKGFVATNSGADAKTHSTPLPHKTIATRAGLGWIGKCALLVTEEYGSAVRLTTILTDTELTTSKSINVSKCGDCEVCVGACPGHAPSGRDWRLGLYRDFFFNAWDCRNTARKLTQERIGILDDVCGICIAVCPWTRKYFERNK